MIVLFLSCCVLIYDKRFLSHIYRHTFFAIKRNLRENKFSKLISLFFRTRFVRVKIELYLQCNGKNIKLLCYFAITLNVLTIVRKTKSITPPGGLEPPTFRLTAERASQLRHGGHERQIFTKSFSDFLFFIIQCSPLIRITLGRHKSDKTKRMIQLTDVFCTLPAIFDKRLILLSMIQLIVGLWTFNWIALFFNTQIVKACTGGPCYMR